MYDDMGKKGKSYLALRKIRSIDYEFDVPTVAERAKDIYIDAQKALAEWVIFLSLMYFFFFIIFSDKF